MVPEGAANCQNEEQPSFPGREVTMQFNPERVRENVRKADTDDLLDRVTVYRDEMEPEALEIIETELHARKVSDAQIEKHGRQREQEVLKSEDGRPLRCRF